MVDHVTFDFKKAQADARAAFSSVDIPSNYWLNISPYSTQTDTVIACSTGGNLWVFFEYGGSEPPPVTLYDNGQTIQVPLGQSNFQVSPWFLLLYDLGAAPGSAIKIGYALT